MKNIENNWESNFNRLFVKQGFPIGIVQYTNKDGTDITPSKIKSFISQLLQQEREKAYERAIEVVKEMHSFDMYDDPGFQAALKEVIEALEDGKNNIK